MQSVILPTVRAEEELSKNNPQRSMELLRTAAPYEKWPGRRSEPSTRVIVFLPSSLNDIPLIFDYYTGNLCANFPSHRRLGVLVFL